MKNLQMAGLWILVAVFLAIILWSFWPAPLHEAIYQTNLETPLIMDQKCSIESVFKAISFTLVYPEKVNSKEVADLEIQAKKVVASEELAKANCDYSLQTVLEMNGARISPGSHLIQPLNANSDQIFHYEFKPEIRNGALDGSLWIYLLSKKISENQSESLPLFVVPLKISIRTLLGIPLDWSRLIGFAGLSIIFIVLIFHKKNRMI